MVATAATSAFFPAISPSSDSGAKSTKFGSGSVNPGGSRQKSSRGLHVKANAQAPPKINGTSVGLEGVKFDDDLTTSPPPRTFINLLPDWSMLLAAITTIFLAAEKQWMMLDWKPRRPDMLIDPFGLGRIVQDGLVFRQNFSIRSYEIGADRTASIETLMNHLQETALNHVKTAGLLGDGFGSTPEMCKKNLIWVVAKMQVVVDRYPTWGDVVQVDTWVCASGKNGMRRDWLVRDCKTGETLTRASSVWVMMNKQTRKLSKIPGEVRGEIEPYFADSPPIVEEDGRKLPKLDDDSADYIRTGLTPRWSDLDINQHVNNVKYIGWILESAPLPILESHELSTMTLEYRRECGRDSMLQSLTAVSGTGISNLADSGDIECQHLLRLENGAEIVRGRTEWRPKHATNITARRVAAGLHSLGINKGDVVMNLLPNSPEFVFTFLAASYRGAIMTAANPFYTAVEIAKQAKAANAKLIVTMACFYDRVKDLAENGVKIVCVDFAVEGCLHFSVLSGADESNAPPVDFSPDDVVALPYSSGTTGLPKGVMLTHKGLITSVAQQMDGQNPNLYYHGDDAILCVLPFFHIYSLNSILLCGLRVGAAIVIMQKFDIVSLLQLIEKYRISIMPIVPPIFLAIAKSPEFEKYDVSSVRVLKSGGAPLGKELEDAVREKFPAAVLGQGYGMTEAGPVLSMSLAFAKEPFEVKAGACGTVVRNAEMKIVDPETGASLPANSAGEICIRGDQIMKGYLNDLESTKRTIDKEGWLHTGDIGFVDDDDEIFIVDRLKELIKFKAFQVAPAELEALLITHPKLSDAAVIGMPDMEAGEVPVAFVVKANGGAISEEEVKQFITKQVVFYKRLKRVFFVNAIPKAPSGKILRKELRTKLASGAYN